MALGERFKGTLGALVVAYLAGLWLASLESTKRILGGEPPLALTALRVALGPLAGWIEGALAGHLVAGLWVLAPATLFVGWLLGIWFMVRSWLMLAIATFVWISIGYFFAIAIYV